MRNRNVVIISTAMVGIAILLAVAIYLSRCPVEFKLVSVEPADMMDRYGKEAMLVILGVSNRDSVSVMLERVSSFQALVGGQWVEVEEAFSFGQISPGRKLEEMLVMPGGTEACRFRFNYQSEIWKSRLMVSLGPTGRRWLAKSPRLYGWIWPNPYKTMHVPPRWKQITVEVPLPKSHSKPVTPSPRAHNNALQHRTTVSCYRSVLCPSRPQSLNFFRWATKSASDGVV